MKQLKWINSLGIENVNADLNLNLVKWLAQGAQITFNIAQEYLKYLIGDTDSKKSSY